LEETVPQCLTSTRPSVRVSGSSATGKTGHRHAQREVGREQGEAVLSGDKRERYEPERLHDLPGITRLPWNANEIAMARQLEKSRRLSVAPLARDVTSGNH
jgi:hypothetical protein